MNPLKHFLSKLPPWALTVVVGLAILWLTLAPQPLPDNDLHLFQGADKVVHALMFGTLTLCVYIDKSRSSDWRRLGNVTLWTVAAICTLSGVLIECIQSTVGRSFELYDMLADTAGCLAALLLWMWLQHDRL